MVTRAIELGYRLKLSRNFTMATSTEIVAQEVDPIS